MSCDLAPPSPLHWSVGMSYISQIGFYLVHVSFLGCRVMTAGFVRMKKRRFYSGFCTDLDFSSGLHSHFIISPASSGLVGREIGCISHLFQSYLVNLAVKTVHVTSDVIGWEIGRNRLYRIFVFIRNMLNRLYIVLYYDS